MKFPNRKVLGITGDVNSLDYGGGIIYHRDDGENSGNMWEFWPEPTPEDESLWDEYTVYRTQVPDSVLREYCKPFDGECNIHDPHFEARAEHSGAERKCTCRPCSSRHRGGWVEVAKVAGMVGVTPTEWARKAHSKDLMDRVSCLEDICSYYGAENLDSYPWMTPGAEIKERWQGLVKF